VTVSPWTVAPTALALAFGLLYLVFEPRPGDLAVHVFRAELFEREGFTIWNGHLYGGHNTPAYSVLSGPLSWLLGPRGVLAGPVLPAPSCSRPWYAATSVRSGRGWERSGSASGP
jgi:hypothetical protein